MTCWPYCLPEIGLYSLFVGVVIWMALDVSRRCRQLRECDDEHDDAARPSAAAPRSTDTAQGSARGAPRPSSYQDERPPVSVVRRKRDRGDGPPLAS